MRTLYLDCGMGAAGDMLTAALLDLLPEREKALEKLNALGIPGVVYAAEKSVKCGVAGTHVTVTVNGAEESEEQHYHMEHDKGHHGRGMYEIGHLIDRLSVSETVRADIRAVYAQIAEAESHVHDRPVTEIHFHEVGTMDALADITAVCVLMEELAPETVVVSPVHVGSGTVRCAHGILPVPAPATAWILREVPIYGGAVSGELCTPTGAALLKHFAARFGDMPVMRTMGIGYGMGKKDFEAANTLRAFWGETQDTGDTVTVFSCNLDDMTAEAVGFAQETLLAAGALEVYALPAQMKKSRPGILLTVLCRREDRERILRLIFLHTTTIGVRETESRRHTLSRTVGHVPTVFGDVALKRSSGYGVVREKYEYEDLARIARERDLSLADVEDQIAANCRKSC